MHSWLTKRALIITALLAAISGMIILGLLHGRGSKLVCKWDYAGLIVTKPYYQSWSVSLADGYDWSDHKQKWVPRWCKPHVQHVSMEGFLWQGGNHFVFTNTNAVVFVVSTNPATGALTGTFKSR